MKFKRSRRDCMMSASKRRLSWKAKALMMSMPSTYFSKICTSISFGSDSNLELDICKRKKRKLQKMRKRISDFLPLIKWICLRQSSMRLRYMKIFLSHPWHRLLWCVCVCCFFTVIVRSPLDYYRMYATSVDLHWLLATEEKKIRRIINNIHLIITLLFFVWQYEMQSYWSLGKDFGFLPVLFKQDRFQWNFSLIFGEKKTHEFF